MKMKTSRIIPFALLLSVFAITGCQRDRGVSADSSEYQPRPAPTSGEIKGELLHVDPSGKTIGVRLETGVEQTFRIDQDTIVEGLPSDTKKTNKPAKVENPEVMQLSGKEGSEVKVAWDLEGGSKIAREIEIRQLVNAKNARRRHR